MRELPTRNPRRMVARSTFRDEQQRSGRATLCAGFRAGLQPTTNFEVGRTDQRGSWRAIRKCSVPQQFATGRKFRSETQLSWYRSGVRGSAQDCSHKNIPTRITTIARSWRATVNAKVCAGLLQHVGSNTKRTDRTRSLRAFRKSRLCTIPRAKMNSDASSTGGTARVE